jgi:hypothetical protein
MMNFLVRNRGLLPNDPPSRIPDPAFCTGYYFRSNQCYVVFFYVFAIRFVKLYWPAEAHKLKAKQARVFFYEFGGSACLNFMPFLKQYWL